MIRACAVAACLAGSATAQNLPDVYAVTDVAADDVLNVRLDPYASAPIVDTLSPQDTGIEVLALTPNGDWGKIGIVEGNGWVAMRYMTALPQTADFPLPMTCFGTEPFWTLSMTKAGTQFDILGGQSINLTLAQTTLLPAEYFAEFASDTELESIANIRREYCSDGMSDRTFGFKVSLYNSEIIGGGAFAGCCTLETGN